MWLGHVAIYIIIAGVGREGDLHLLHLLGEDDLTAQTAGAGETGGFVEHIFLLFGGCRQLVVSLATDDHVTC